MDQSLVEKLGQARAGFEKLDAEIRPELHRYCARMTGSVIDGEDIVQDTLAKAFYLLPQTANIPNLRSWIFRVAHNEAIDYTRGYARRFSEPLDNRLEVALEVPQVHQEELTRTGLALFMKLTPIQRAAVILKDVLDHSLAEIAEILDMNLAGVKAALHRGRASLRRLAQNPNLTIRASLDDTERARLREYVKHFAAREFNALSSLLADDARVDIIGVSGNSASRTKAEVGCYFGRYSSLTDWFPRPGTVEGHNAVLVFDAPETTERPCYFVLVDWANGRIAHIRDYRHVEYIMADAEFTAIG